MLKFLQLLLKIICIIQQILAVSLDPANYENNIGQLKLEYQQIKDLQVDKAVFLGPKAYFLQGIDEQADKNIIKVKGLNSKILNAKETGISFDIFEQLLYKDSDIKINQHKWFKKLSEGSIAVVEQCYTVKHNSNKRELIYDDNYKSKDLLMVATKPYVLSNEE